MVQSPAFLFLSLSNKLSQLRRLYAVQEVDCEICIGNHWEGSVCGTFLSTAHSDGDKFLDLTTLWATPPLPRFSPTKKKKKARALAEQLRRVVFSLSNFYNILHGFALI